jgi:hypothetical protein
VRVTTDDIYAKLAELRPQAIELLRKFADDDDPRIAEQARKLLRRHAPNVSPVVEKCIAAKQRGLITKE